MGRSSNSSSNNPRSGSGGKSRSRASRSRNDRRPSTVFYKNDSKRCSQITSRHERCKNDVFGGGNYCKYHETLRNKRVAEHAKLLKKRGGRTSMPPPSKARFEYNYYLDDEIEPFDSNASLVSSSPQIWIGSIDSAHDRDFLKGSKIKSVINISGMEPTLKARDMYKNLGVDYYTLSEIEKVPYKSHYRVSKYLGDEKFSRHGLTPREFFKFMHRGCQMMNQKGFKFPVLIHCFTEEHQLLTNKGFMFLHEIESYEKDDLLFASYDPDSKQIVYDTYKLVINPYQEYDMIDMTQNNERRRWDNKSDCYGRCQSDERESPSNSVSLVTTTGHKMYVKHGLSNTSNKSNTGIYWKSHKVWNSDRTESKYIQNDYEKVDAENLLSDNERECVKFLGRAFNGIQHKIQYLPFIEQLLLDTEQKIKAFLELYGYWLGDGSLSIKKEGGSWEDSIVFHPVKRVDSKWIQKRLNILELKNKEDYKTYKTTKNTRVVYYITNNRWVDLFHGEYSCKYKLDYYDDCKSSKWMANWVWSLDKSQSRNVLRGLKMADGDEANNENAIYTSSINFRDEIIRLAFHAGYSPTFLLKYEKGSSRGFVNGVEAIARFDNWRVSYNDGVQYAEPNLRRKRDIKKTKYTGRTWCVTVPHGFVIARRAHFDKEKGYITKASRPIITSNCHAGVNRSGSLIASYLMTKPRPYGYDKTVDLLKKANRRRNLDVLTNQDFKRALKYFPVFMGTPTKVSPRTMARYKQFLSSYER